MKSFIHTKVLGDFHTALYRLMGLVTDYIDAEGRSAILSQQEHWNEFCTMMRRCPEGLQLCLECDRCWLQTCRETRAPQVYVCHAGLTEVIVPLFVRGQMIGALCAGQVAQAKPSEKQFERLWRRYPFLHGCDRRQLLRLYLKTKTLTMPQITAATELLSLVGNYIAESENRLSFLQSMQDHGPVVAARKYIEANSRQSLTIPQLAAKVSLSESHFSHLFKQQTGIAPLQYLNRCRIKSAMELLEQPGTSVTDAAFRCGFKNLTHFNRIFRRFAGVSPRMYREKSKQNAALLTKEKTCLMPSLS